MKCTTCQDAGLDEIGGFVIPCRECEAGRRRVVYEMESHIKHAEKALRKDRKYFKQLIKSYNERNPNSNYQLDK